MIIPDTSPVSLDHFRSSCQGTVVGVAQEEHAPEVSLEVSTCAATSLCFNFEWNVTLAN